MTNVFISYRRSDTTSGYASWIYDRLAQEYGAEHVFMDMDSLALGVDFVEQLQLALAKSDVALVLIGPAWLDATDASGQRRLDDAADFVRIEVGAALRASARVIPVLIDGASIPDSTQLPEELQPLSRRQALTFQRQGGAAINNLVVAIEQLARAESGDAAADTAWAAPSREIHDPAPGAAHRQRSGRALALAVIALVALAGIAAGALIATGTFSHNAPPPAVPAARVNATTHTSPASTSSQVTTQPTGQQSTAPGAPVGTTSCGGDLSVGPNTSCGFAQNVEQAYDHTAGGNQTVTAFSPVTGVTYTIDCSGSVPHACTGGSTHAASVYFTSGPTSGGATPNGIPASALACRGGVYVGANTSCGFAQNVHRAYYHGSGGDTNVTAFSPVTGRTYVIHCTGTSPHVCSGGTTDNASVYFP